MSRAERSVSVLHAEILKHMYALLGGKYEFGLNFTFGSHDVHLVLWVGDAIGPLALPDSHAPDSEEEPEGIWIPENSLEHQVLQLVKKFNPSSKRSIREVSAATADAAIRFLWTEIFEPTINKDDCPVWLDAIL